VIEITVWIRFKTQSEKSTRDSDALVPITRRVTAVMAVTSCHVARRRSRAASDPAPAAPARSESAARFQHLFGVESESSNHFRLREIIDLDLGDEHGAGAVVPVVGHEAADVERPAEGDGGAAEVRPVVERDLRGGWGGVITRAGGLEWRSLHRAGDGIPTTENVPAYLRERGGGGREREREREKGEGEREREEERERGIEGRTEAKGEVKREDRPCAKGPEGGTASSKSWSESGKNLGRIQKAGGSTHKLY
jgi:hypothetical protein